MTFPSELRSLHIWLDESDSEYDENTRHGVETNEEDAFHNSISTAAEEVLEDSLDPDTSASTLRVPNQLTQRLSATSSSELLEAKENEMKTLPEERTSRDGIATRAAKRYEYAIPPWQGGVSTIILFAALVLFASGLMYYMLGELRRPTTSPSPLPHIQ